MNIPKRYARELCSEIGYLPVWPPGKKLRIGNVLAFDRGEYEVQARTLDDLGRRSFTRPGHLRHASRGDVRATIKADTHPAALNVSFASEDALLFDAQDCRVEHLEEVGTLERAIAAATDWNPHWYVVTEVLEAQGLLLLIARQKGASIDVRVPSLDIPSLGGAGVALAASQSGAVTHVQLPVTHGAWHCVGFKAMRYVGASWLRTLKFERAHAMAPTGPARIASYAGAEDLVGSDDDPSYPGAR